MQRSGGAGPARLVERVASVYKNFREAKDFEEFVEEISHYGDD